jgi:single-stranded DNA-specific DHH superfamily exonuclease
MYYGGHKKAAGFSIKESNIQPFKEAFCKSLGGVTIKATEIDIDVITELNSILGVNEELKCIEPCGEANPIPMVAIFDVEIKSLKRSRRGLDSLLRVCQDGSSVDLVAFNETRYIDQFTIGQKVDIAIKVFSNSGYSDSKLELIDIKTSIPH